MKYYKQIPRRKLFSFENYEYVEPDLGYFNLVYWQIFAYMWSVALFYKYEFIV